MTVLMKKFHVSHSFILRKISEVNFFTLNISNIKSKIVELYLQATSFVITEFSYIFIAKQFITLKLRVLM